MNRAFPSFVKFLSVALFALSSFVHATEDKAAAKADLAKGSTLYTNGDPSRGIMACLACHGAAGNSTIAQNPKLAAQHEAYLQKQLHEFKGPSRNNAIMTSIAKAMNDDDIRDVAAFLNEQKPAPGAARNKNTIDFGKKFTALVSLRKISQPVPVVIALTVQVYLRSFRVSPASIRITPVPS